ncbi:MAG: PaaI family thioesterase [Phycisphaerales bacterium]|nr:MAG: PaaI family thioesterase [Phycisphaerales bacterium]UCG48455.1 MAG: PaaI family thioesterase [Phycisphaerales bacterium]
MNRKAFQELYPEEFSHCYGCGRLNEHGLRIKSYWDGDETVAIFEPRTYHTGVSGYVYGGLIASLIDCHCIGTAAAAKHRAENPDRDAETLPRFVTAALQVDYLRPTPLGVPLEVRARAEEIEGRKIVVAATLSAEGEICARGKVVAVQMPEDMMPAS